MRILYVEDEKYLKDAVVYMLKKSKIDVDWTMDGEEGYKMAQTGVYDCLVLDIMLPNMSGLEILESLRKNHIETPIIMLSALSEVEDKIRGLDLGADDYLAKPFKTSELIARINAISRRPRLVSDKEYIFEDLKYNANNRTLNGELLTEKEGLILEMLIKNPEKTISKSQILSHVWGYSAALEDNYVEVYISFLRNKLKKINSCVTIATIRGLGYKLAKSDV